MGTNSTQQDKETRAGIGSGGLVLPILDKLEADIRSIKDSANESAAGDPPEGYEELEPGSDALRIADECYHAGFAAMETAILNWVHDQRQQNQ